VSLNIKNPEVVRLAEQVARMAGETKTEAIRRALEERKARLKLKSGSPRSRSLRKFLEAEVWSKLPSHALGREISKEEEEKLLGYGEHGA
jgi:antitoxin VapB